MALRNWSNINLIQLEAKGSKRFRLYTLTYLPSVSGCFTIWCLVRSEGPSRSHMCMKICNSTWYTLSIALELIISFVGSGRREKTYWSPYIDDSSPQLPGTRSWNTVVNRDV